MAPLPAKADWEEFTSAIWESDQYLQERMPNKEFEKGTWYEGNVTHPYGHKSNNGNFYSMGWRKGRGFFFELQFLRTGAPIHPVDKIGMNILQILMGVLDDKWGLDQYTIFPSTHKNTIEFYLPMIIGPYDIISDEEKKSLVEECATKIRLLIPVFDKVISDYSELHSHDW